MALTISSRAPSFLDRDLFHIVDGSHHLIDRRRGFLDHGALLQDAVVQVLNPAGDDLYGLIGVTGGLIQLLDIALHLLGADLHIASGSGRILYLTDEKVPDAEVLVRDVP